MAQTVKKERKEAPRSPFFPTRVVSSHKKKPHGLSIITKRSAPVAFFRAISLEKKKKLARRKWEEDTNGNNHLSTHPRRRRRPLLSGLHSIQTGLSSLPSPLMQYLSRMPATTPSLPQSVRPSIFRPFRSPSARPSLFLKELFLPRAKRGREEGIAAFECTTNTLLRPSVRPSVSQNRSFFPPISVRASC